jgi:hypothetical protein
MGSTTTQGYPYPLGTDRVMDGDDAIKALAEKADANAGATASGRASASTTNTPSGTVVVTFPAGRFVAAPTSVVACAYQASTYIVSTSTITATTVTLTIRYYLGSNTTATIECCWFARS